MFCYEILVCMYACQHACSVWGIVFLCLCGGEEIWYICYMDIINYFKYWVKNGSCDEHPI